MATATRLLSTHSSNPLEAPSSDHRNQVFVRQYQAAKAEEDVDLDSSEEEAAQGNESVREYQKHVAGLYPHLKGVSIKGLGGDPHSKANAMAGPSKIKGKASELPPPDVVDLDEDMSDVPEITAPPMLEDSEDEQGDEILAGLDKEGSGSDEDIEMNDDELEGEVLEDIDLGSSAQIPSSSLAFHMKPPEEQADIQMEIADLENAVPQLAKDYKLVDRLGAGTFSSVYKAIDLHYEGFDNSVWERSRMYDASPMAHPSSSSKARDEKRKRGKVYVAVKRIYVTSGPERVRNELTIMEECRGCRHISQLITAFRYRDQVVAIMPYCRNADYRSYYRDLPFPTVKAYFRCLFRALFDVHARGIIHRDVKPANFLFDPSTGVGTLCDFGLASRMDRDKQNAPGLCLHTAASKHHPHGRVRRPEDYDPEYIKRMQREARLKSQWPSDRVGYPERDTRPPSKANRAGTRGFRAPEVLLKCGLQSGAIDVWSAGVVLLFFLTKKFPIFQAGDDVEALMEIATIIGKRKMEKIATLHSRLFQTNVPSVTNDGITWEDFVERQNPDLRTPPTGHDTRFWPYCLDAGSTKSPARPPPTSSSPTSTIHHISPSRSPSPNAAPSPEAVSAQLAEEHERDVEDALSLLTNILNPDATKRFTPLQALSHPFLRDPTLAEDEDEEDLAPHPFGLGVCGELHFIDNVGNTCVYIWDKRAEKGKERPARKRPRRGDNGELEADSDEDESPRGMIALVVAPGEGIAVGRTPCEFHKEELGYSFE